MKLPTRKPVIHYLTINTLQIIIIILKNFKSSCGKKCICIRTDTINFYIHSLHFHDYFLNMIIFVQQVKLVVYVFGFWNFVISGHSKKKFLINLGSYLKNHEFSPEIGFLSIL